MHVFKFKYVLATILIAGSVSVSYAQDTTVTKETTVIRPDGSYTVIEYPVDKEVTVALTPSAVLTGGKGMARVMRSADGTRVYVDVTGVPSTVKNYYAYAVDPNGTPTLLGPLTFTGGSGNAEFSTPMSQFMLVLSPAEGLTGVTASNVVFTSEVPPGYAIVQRRVVEGPVSAVAASTFVKYDVPLLNVPSYGEDAKNVKLRFGGELKGLEAQAHIHRHSDGPTTVRVKFDDLKKVPAGKRFILWTASRDGKYTKLGQIYNFRNKDEATIDAKTTLDDFGLLMTVEDAEVTVPTSRIFSVFTYTP